MTLNHDLDSSRDILPDSCRIIAHFDVDAFYAQVEEVRRPDLKGLPVGVTQKYLLVTCNYAARALGVTKLMGIKEALSVCPSLNLVSGEDLSPYRQASKAIWKVLSRFGTCQRGGMDEAYLDATAEVMRRLETGDNSGKWYGHIHSGNNELMQDSAHRPQDLRVAPHDRSDPNSGLHSFQPSLHNSSQSLAHDYGSAMHEHDASSRNPWQLLLRVGSEVTYDARQAIKKEAGYDTSAGIACNKMLAKLCGGLHKPHDQTVLPPPFAAAFVSPLPVRAVSGIGYKTANTLADLGVTTVVQLRNTPLPLLVSKFRESMASVLFENARGKCSSPVVEVGPPKSITCEDSFKSCSSFDSARCVVRVLAPDLIGRVLEELAESGRWPRTFTVKWRIKSQGRSSASCPLPSRFQPRMEADLLEHILEDLCMVTLTKQLKCPFHLTLLNLGVTSMQPHATTNPSCTLKSLFNASSSTTVTAATAPSLSPTHHHPPLVGTNPLITLPEKRSLPPGPLTATGQDEGPHIGKRMCVARRDYGAHALSGLRSKRAERALTESNQSRVHPQPITPTPNTPSSNARLRTHHIDIPHSSQPRPCTSDHMQRTDHDTIPDHTTPNVLQSNRSDGPVIHASGDPNSASHTYLRPHVNRASFSGWTPQHGGGALPGVLQYEAYEDFGSANTSGMRTPASRPTPSHSHTQTARTCTGVHNGMQSAQTDSLRIGGDRLPDLGVREGQSVDLDGLATNNASSPCTRDMECCDATQRGGGCAEIDRGKGLEKVNSNVHVIGLSVANEAIVPKAVSSVSQASLQASVSALVAAIDADECMDGSGDWNDQQQRDFRLALSLQQGELTRNRHATTTSTPGPASLTNKSSKASQSGKQRGKQQMAGKGTGTLDLFFKRQAKD